MRAGANRSVHADRDPRRAGAHAVDEGNLAAGQSDERGWRRSLLCFGGGSILMHHGEGKAFEDLLVRGDHSETALLMALPCEQAR